MHRFLVLGATLVVALALSGVASAWSWPADGQVLRAFELGSDTYAPGQHRGIDVAAAPGTPVRAPAAGTVTFAGSVPTHGRGVTILTADGYSVTLFHLESVDVAKGDVVDEGAAVGTMGSSGEAEHSVPTVHLGIRVADRQDGYVDPIGLLPARPVQPASPPPPPAPAPATAPATPPAPAPTAPTPVAQPPAATPPPTQPVAPPVVPAPAAASSAVSPPAVASPAAPPEPVRVAALEIASAGADTGRDARQQARASPRARRSAAGSSTALPVRRTAHPSRRRSRLPSTSARRRPATREAVRGEVPSHVRREDVGHPDQASAPGAGRSAPVVASHADRASVRSRAVRAPYSRRATRPQAASGS